ncbi:uncharacterized protein ofcc1 [Menidia menidia]
MDTFDRKLQQKALQQPKQKKSNSAEFLMGRDENATVVGIENPAFDGGGSSELSIPPSWPGRKMRGDRPDSTLAAHRKKMELRAPAKERGNECAQNYFDPSEEEQTDPRHRGATGVSAEDELELTMLNADENRLYERMAALLDDDTFIDLPGTLRASGDEEVLEVKAGDLLLRGGAGASGPGPSRAPAAAKTQAEGCVGPGGEAGLQAGRTVMGNQSTAKIRAAEEVIPPYTQQLRERVRPDMITLGRLSLQQVRATKRNICVIIPYSPAHQPCPLCCVSVVRANGHWSVCMHQETQKGPVKRSEWAKRKKRLMAFFTGSVEDPSSVRDGEEAALPPPVLNTLFQHRDVESLSVRALGEGQEEAAAKCSHNRQLPESFASASQTLWQEEQGTLPRPVEVRVCCLRSTREKLPRGLYSVSVALHSHLGGPALAFKSKKAKKTWAVSTEPTEHRGRFHDNDLHINQSVVMDFLAACDVSPSMVLVFQLTSLHGHGGPAGSVLAWGAFPVCGPNINPIRGRFKTPMLRGEPSIQLDQFRKIEALISSDLDHWLCNLYFEVKTPSPGTCEKQEMLLAASSVPPTSLAVFPKPDVHQDQPQLFSQAAHPHRQQHVHTHSGCGAGEPTAVHSHQGSPLHLSACSSSTLPGKHDSSEPYSGNVVEKCDPCREKADDVVHNKKKPIKKTNSCGPGMPRQAGKQKMQPSIGNLSVEEMEEHTFSLQSALASPGSCAPRLSDRARLALCMLPSEVGLPLPRQQQQQQLGRGWRGSVRQLGLIMLLLALMWFVRLYLHYCSQWLYLQAIAVPVNKFRFHAHTVDLVYQSSLLHTREELAMVVVGPLTLNAATFLLVLIRWGCQVMFGSLPSFTSKFIMAQGVWTVLDPLAVFAVDAVLGRLTYSPDVPVADAAKLYWHFYRADQSGAAGAVITVFLYAVHFLLSITILSLYLFRFHNDGRMLDIFQRLTAREGLYFLPEDLELSNQELNYIVKKAEQWRGFSGERRKVAVYDNIWTSEDPQSGSAASGDGSHEEGAPSPESETSTHVIIYTLYLSGLRQRYRHFLRQPDGTIVEVIGKVEGADDVAQVGARPGPSPATREGETRGASGSPHLRKRMKFFGRSRRVEPEGGS